MEAGECFLARSKNFDSTTSIIEAGGRGRPTTPTAPRRVPPWNARTRMNRVGGLEHAGLLLISATGEGKKQTDNARGARTMADAGGGDHRPPYDDSGRAGRRQQRRQRRTPTASANRRPAAEGGQQRGVCVTMREERQQGKLE